MWRSDPGFAKIPCPIKNERSAASWSRGAGGLSRALPGIMENFSADERITNMLTTSSYIVLKM